MNGNAEIRKAVNEFCLNHVFDVKRRQLAGNRPVVITVFLGRESESRLGDTLKEAFCSMLNVEPAAAYITLDEETLAQENYFQEAVMGRISAFSSDGNIVRGRIANIQLSFAAVMDDPVMALENLPEVLPHLKQAVDNIRKLNVVQFGATGFFGVFDQDRTKTMYDYAGAVRAVNSGSPANAGLWENVYHLEKTFIEHSYDSVCRTVAMQILNDQMFTHYSSNRSAQDRENYYWKSIGLDELKIPEQLLCRLLSVGYQSHFANQELNKDEQEQFARALEEEFSRKMEEVVGILRYGDWVNYLPRRAEEKLETIKKWFGRTETRRLPLRYSEMFLNENDCDTILTAMCRPYIEKLSTTEKLLEIFLAALGHLNRLDSAVARQHDTIRMIAEQLKKNMDHHSRVLTLSVDGENEAQYIKRLYEKYAAKEKMETARDILANALQNGEFWDRLKTELETVRRTTDNLVSALETIRVENYGGTQTLKADSIETSFAFPVGIPVEKALQHLDQATINSLIEDCGILSNNVDSFVTKVRENSINSHSIGQFTGEYKSVDDTSYYVIADQDHNVEIQGMSLRSNALFRANTMQILHSKEWNSQRCLTNYV